MSEYLNLSYDFPDDHHYIYRIITWSCHCYTAYFFNGFTTWSKDRIADDCVTHCQVKVI